MRTWPKSHNPLYRRRLQRTEVNTCVGMGAVASLTGRLARLAPAVCSFVDAGLHVALRYHAYMYIQYPGESICDLRHA